MIKGSCDFMEESSSLFLTPLSGLGAKGTVIVDIKFFSLSRYLTWPRAQSFVWLNGLKFLIVNHHFAKFNDHRPFGRSEIAAKIFYVTLQNHVIKEPGEFMVGNSSLYIPTQPNFESHRHCVNWYIIIWVFHVILQNFLIIRSCDFMGRIQSR